MDRIYLYISGCKTTIAACCRTVDSPWQLHHLQCLMDYSVVYTFHKQLGSFDILYRKQLQVGPTAHT